jgi:hypothetical protein
MQTAAQLTANHLYTEVVIDDYPFLTIGIDKPYNTPTSASSIVADLDHDAINQIPIAHKQDLLRKITTAHFVYSSEAKKLLRMLSDRESAGLDASDILARMASLPISTRCAVMRNMDMVVDESLSCFTPNVVNVTFSSWDHRPLQPCSILVNFNVTGAILLAQSMAHQFVHPPPIRGSTSVESLFAYRCRSRCEGLPSIRLQQSFSANPTEINVVHHWNLMYPPYLVFGAQNDIIISIFEHEAPLDTITAHVMCLLSIVNSDTWCQATHHQGEGDSPSMDTTRITLHIRQHHMNGKRPPHCRQGRWLHRSVGRDLRGHLQWSCLQRWMGRSTQDRGGGSQSEVQSLWGAL